MKTTHPKLLKEQVVGEGANHNLAPVGVLTVRNQEQHPIVIGFGIHAIKTRTNQVYKIKLPLKGYAI